MSATHINGGEAVKPASPAGSASKQQPLKAGAGGKALDTARKQAASPIDSQTKKQVPPPPKAWQGPNPITSRANAASHLPNGTEKTPPKIPSPAPATRANTETNSDKRANDRLIFLLANITGQDATITLKNGEQFIGVFSGASFDSPSKHTYLLKMVRRTRLASHQQQQVNGVADVSEDFIGEGEDHIMAFDIQDTIDLAVNEVVVASAHPAQNGSLTSSFRTDGEISRRDPHQPRERELKRWEPETELSLDDLALDTSGGRGWDQFAANEQAFGVQSSYDEDIYTTSIDRSHPDFARRTARAERIAREIEGSTPADAHVAEERRKDADRDDAGGDEEDKYSGVKRDLSPLAKGSSGSYVPPSRRPITGQPTVQGAPYDPAIIASQLARPAPPQTQQPLSTSSAEKAAEPTKALDPESKRDEKKPAALEAATKNDVGTSSSTTTQAPKKSPNTTEDRVRDTADAFKQFANTEKLRIRQAQEQKRTNARLEKNVRLNDLKKFAENFKLKSRVPDDLVPILAKDHEKQLEIKRKAEEAASTDEVQVKEQVKEKSSPAVAAPTPTNGPQPGTTPGTDQRAPIPPPPPPQQQQQPPRNRAPLNRSNYVPQPTPGMSPRQAQIFNRTSRPVPQLQTGPSEHRLQSGSSVQNDQGPLSPSSATRLNVNAKAFEFRPAAINFTPSATSPSPQRNTAALPAPDSPMSFFAEKESNAIRSRQADGGHGEEMDMVMSLRAGDLTEEQKKSLASSGGVPQPYRAAPTWTVPEERLNVTFNDAFPKQRGSSTTHHGPSPMHTPNLANGQVPHSHQLPPHMQTPQISTPSQPHRFYPPQQPGMSHSHGQFDPRMQFPGGAGNSVQNSPRFPPAQMAAFNGQMNQMGQMPQFAGQPMPYAMSPNLSYRQMQMPSGGVMMMPGQPHGQMPQMRQHFPQGPQFAPNMPQMGGQMMAQQASSGGYGNGPMPQQYSPMPPHAQPHMQHMPQHPGGPGGYSSSPRPGPNMMQHNGSHQGYQPHHMNVPYATSPGQPGPYALSHRQMSAGQYPQMTPRQQQAMPVQQNQHVPSPGMTAPVQAQGDEGK